MSLVSIAVYCELHAMVDRRGAPSSPVTAIDILFFLDFQLKHRFRTMDLQIEIEELISEDWLCADFTYGVDTNSTDHANHLDVFAYRLKALDQIHRGRAVTWDQSKKQLDRLTSHLQSTIKNDSCTDKQDDEDTDYDKLEIDLQSAFDRFDEEQLEDNFDDDTICADNR